MKQIQNDVMAFHQKFGNLIERRPTTLDHKTRDLRMNLITEEFDELMEGLETGDLAKIADGAADLIYVIMGTTISCGIDMVPVWNEVQRTNMLKEGGATREDGKILKPEGWQPPRIAEIIADQQEHWCPQCEHNAK